MKDNAPERINTMEGINFMGNKMVIEIDSFEKKFHNQVRKVTDALSHVDVNSRIAIEKSLDSAAEELTDLKKRVENSLLLNSYNMSTMSRGF